MTRNFHDPKDYEWKDDGNMLVCTDAGDSVFTVFNDGLRDVALNAYHAGLNRGKRMGRLSLRQDIKALLDGKNE